MKIICGYMTNFNIEAENTQDEKWLDEFIKDLYKDAKEKKTLKFINDAFWVQLDDNCIKTNKDGSESPVGHCTVSEYGMKNGWSQTTFAKGIEFNMDF